MLQNGFFEDLSKSTERLCWLGFWKGEELPPLGEGFRVCKFVGGLHFPPTGTEA